MPCSIEKVKVPLSLGTADPACQLWDKLDDLARLPYPVLCGSLILSGLCFEAILSREKKKIEKTDQPGLNIIVLTSLREIWSVMLTKNPLIQNLNMCILC